jgi:AcrR family transcriptional regulator
VTKSTDSASVRRIGTEASKTRAALLDAARKLMLEEGYAAVTSRRVAARAGLKPQLVHYYFRTMEELFLTLFRQGAEQNLQRHTQVLASPRPLRALWEFSCDATGMALTFEFVALANHRKAIRAELLSYAERFRAVQLEVVATALERAGVDPALYPPEAVLMVLAGVGQFVSMEVNLGLTTGHQQTRATVERLLHRLEPSPSNSDNRDGEV